MKLEIDKTSNYERTINDHIKYDIHTEISKKSVRPVQSKVNNEKTNSYNLDDYEKITLICEGEPVYLNVYNLAKCNVFLSCLGIGIYHTTIQLFKAEFCYGMTYSNNKSGIGIGNNENSSLTFKGIFYIK